MFPSILIGLLFFDLKEKRFLSSLRGGSLKLNLLDNLSFFLCVSFSSNSLLYSIISFNTNGVSIIVQVMLIIPFKGGKTLSTNIFLSGSINTSSSVG